MKHGQATTKPSRVKDSVYACVAATGLKVKTVVGRVTMQELRDVDRTSFTTLGGTDPVVVIALLQRKILYQHDIAGEGILLRVENSSTVA